jgi:uncharacterized protein (DUF983 family)
MEVKNKMDAPANSGLSAMVNGLCPQCRRGRLFQNPILSLKFGKTNEFCSCCGVKFEVEPGFFYGAMFVSYAINASVVVAGVILYFLFFSTWSEWFAIIGVGIVTLFLTPFTFRASRSFYLHAFSGLKFDER